MRAEFQRARAPAEKAQRRRQILAACAALLAAGGWEAVSLSAIARGAGIAKSNLYRYFESREDILLELLVEDEDAWVGELEGALAPLAGRGDIDAVARAVAATLAARPATCKLIPLLAGVLEQNVSAAAVLRFKTRLLGVSLRIGNALHVAVPGLPHAQTGALLRYLHALVAGLWPMAHPPAASARLLQRPEFQAMACRFEDDLAHSFAALLAGLLQPR